ncbi:MAG TPA: hypothetical protein VJR89_25295 [Polyangiales bacterium]|nr:hypothetical protein [Polyangiales bacterium]
MLSFGCSRSVDPLNCSLDDYLYPTSAQAMRLTATSPIDVEFSSSWGQAPARMRSWIHASGPDELELTSCGRDQSEQLWELKLHWSRLPAPASYPLEIDSIANYFQPTDSGARFSGVLDRCGKYGCGFPGGNTAFNTRSDTSVDTRIVRYDRDAGRATASIVVHDTVFHEPDARLSLHLEWDPASLESDAGEGDAAVLDAASEP